MKYIITYLLIVAITTFVFCFVKLKNEDGWDDFEVFIAPLFWGFFWPIGIPLYGACLGAKALFDYLKEGHKGE